MTIDWSRVPAEYGYVARGPDGIWWAYKDKETCQNERAWEPRGFCLGAVGWDGMGVRRTYCTRKSDRGRHA
jgi:hypothetical protein